MAEGNDLVKAVQEAAKILSDAANASESSLVTESANNDYTKAFPHLSARNVKHSEQARMLRYRSVPFPIKDSWTHEFCCLPLKNQAITPSYKEAQALNAAGLGRTKIKFENKGAAHVDVVAVLESTFPALQDCLGFTLHRTTLGGYSRPLIQLQTKWYDIKGIRKEVKSSACIYIRPLQKDLDLSTKVLKRERSVGPTTLCRKCKKTVEITVFKDHSCIKSPGKKEKPDVIEIIDNEKSVNSSEFIDDKNQVLALDDQLDDFDPEIFINPDFFTSTGDAPNASDDQINKEQEKPGGKEKDQTHMEAENCANANDRATSSAHKSEVIKLRIRRMTVLQDMVNSFKNPCILTSELSLTIINAKGEDEEADDFGGVLRDILSAFWDEFYKGHSDGEVEVVPCIRHDFIADDWKAVARILVKGYKDAGYFPYKLCKAFLAATLFGEFIITPEILLHSFYMYLPPDDRSMLQKCMVKETIDIIGDDEELGDMLQSFSSKRIVTDGKQLEQLILEIAHKELIQRPSYIREAWESVMLYTHVFVKDIPELDLLYENAKPTCKKVLKLISWESSSVAERDVTNYLKKFIKSLNDQELGLFMRFVTGADNLCPEKVNDVKLLFTRLDGSSRRVIAHTCGPVLEVPTTYECYAEFKEEMRNILKCGYWNMDFA